VGPYRLLEKIGEGGFGVVYVADQEQPVRRRVALKIIKLGMDTRQVVARFEAERQALVMIDHLHIAEVFDAGNRIEGNNCTGAGRGIDVDALGNIIIKNTCTGATNHAVDTVQ
jgi:parallel beta-helix repeat protein